MMKLLLTSVAVTWVLNVLATAVLYVLYNPSTLGDTVVARLYDLTSGIALVGAVLIGIALFFVIPALYD